MALVTAVNVVVEDPQGKAAAVIEAVGGAVATMLVMIINCDQGFELYVDPPFLYLIVMVFTVEPEIEMLCDPQSQPCATPVMVFVLPLVVMELLPQEVIAILAAGTAAFEASVAEMSTISVK